MRYFWPTLAAIAVVAALVLTFESSIQLVGGLALAVSAYLAGLFVDAMIQRNREH
jgi:hypothetical protein